MSCVLAVRRSESLWRKTGTPSRYLSSSELTFHNKPPHFKSLRLCKHECICEVQGEEENVGQGATHQHSHNCSCWEVTHGGKREQKLRKKVSHNNSFTWSLSQTVNGIFLVTSKAGEEPGQGGVSVLISPVKLISVTQPQHSPLSDLCYPPLVNTHGAVPTLVHPAKLRRSAPMDYQLSY